MHFEHLKADPYRAFSKADRRFFSLINALVSIIARSVKKTLPTVKSARASYPSRAFIFGFTFVKVVLLLRENANESKKTSPLCCFDLHFGEKILRGYGVTDSTIHLGAGGRRA